VIILTLQEAVAETKNFIEAEAELVGVEPEVIMRKIKDEVETAEFVKSTQGIGS